MSPTRELAQQIARVAQPWWMFLGRGWWGQGWVSGSSFYKPCAPVHMRKPASALPPFPSLCLKPHPAHAHSTRPHAQVGAVIVSPTRELAQQIARVAQPFVESVPGLTMQLLVGGTWVFRVLALNT